MYQEMNKGKVLSLVIQIIMIFLEQHHKVILVWHRQRGPYCLEEMADGQMLGAYLLMLELLSKVSIVLASENCLLRI